jgi:hypothetical protein
VVHEVGAAESVDVIPVLDPRVIGCFVVAPGAEEFGEDL